MSPSITLPTFIATQWDRFRNGLSFVGIREATISQLAAAVQHEDNYQARMALGQLHRAASATGASGIAALGDVLAFPRRQPPSRAPAAKVVHLPMRSAVEPELPAEAAD